MWQYVSTQELYHYGVPGMKWGVRKHQRYLSKASKARTSAGDYDALSKRATSRGDAQGAARYAKKAGAARRAADRYSEKAKRFDPNTTVGQIQQYKHDRRVVTAVATSIAALGTYVAAAHAVSSMFKPMSDSEAAAIVKNLKNRMG